VLESPSYINKRAMKQAPFPPGPEAWTKQQAPTGGIISETLFSCTPVRGPMGLYQESRTRGGLRVVGLLGRVP
jgi:hypothetical protein